MNIQEQINNRVELLQSYQTAYHLGLPVPLGAEYDQLFEELRVWDPQNVYPKLLEYSYVGQVRHPEPFLSSRRFRTEEELQQFIARVEKAASHLRGWYNPMLRDRLTRDRLTREVFLTKAHVRPPGVTIDKLSDRQIPSDGT